MATVNAPQRVQSVARAAELLKTLGADGAAEATDIDLADRCGLHRSTAWRILATLEESGLVERDPRTGRYGVGYALVALAAAAGHEPLVRPPHPLLGAPRAPPRRSGARRRGASRCRATSSSSTSTRCRPRTSWRRTGSAGPRRCTRP